MTKNYKRNSLGFLTSGLLAIAGLTGFNASAQYCTPEFYYGCLSGDNIANFSVTGGNTNFSNASGCSDNAYGDYTAQVIVVSSGDTYTFTINHGYSSQQVGIWVDFNNDYTFDTTELLASGTSSGFGSSAQTTGSFSIPSTVTAGAYRLRVVTHYNQTPSPCTNGSYGEAEDYTLLVADATTCLPPTNLEVTATTLTTASLSWVSEGDNFVVEYGTNGFAIGSGTTVNTTTTSTELTGLSSSTQYQYYVKRVCSETNSSVYTGPFAFSTALAPAPTPWSENFATNELPTGWTKSQNIFLNGDNTIFEGSDSFFFYQNLYGSYVEYNSATVTTRPVGPILAGDKLKFKYVLAPYFEGDDVDGTITVQISTNNGVSFQTIHTINHTDATPWTEISSIDLANYVGETVLVRVLMSTNGSNLDSDYHIGLDNFSIASEDTPCNTPAPTGNTSQTIEEGQSLADLVVVGENIKWYTDAALTAEVPATTVPTVSGTTYYATQTVNGCESEEALAVTVEIALSNNELELSSLKVYPNPAKDLLNIDYKTTISQVTVLDINGRKVATYQLNGSNNTISVESLTAGTYFLQIQTEANEISTVKLVKK